MKNLLLSMLVVSSITFGKEPLNEDNRLPEAPEVVEQGAGNEPVREVTSDSVHMSSNDINYRLHLAQENTNLVDYIIALDHLNDIPYSQCTQEQQRIYDTLINMISDLMYSFNRREGEG